MPSIPDSTVAASAWSSSSDDTHVMSTWAP